MGNPIVHVEVLGNDGAAMRKFYGDLFDWEISTVEGIDYGIVSTGSDPAGGIGADPNGQGGHVTFYVQVDDLEAALEQASRWEAAPPSSRWRSPGAAGSRCSRIRRGTSWGWSAGASRTTEVRRYGGTDW